MCAPNLIEWIEALAELRRIHAPEIGLPRVCAEVEAPRASGR
jgi:hypothetical protein